MNDLVIGKEYHLKYKEKICTHANRNTRLPSQWEFTERKGIYEYIGLIGGKYHFYDRYNGIDIFFKKAELKDVIINK